jgi:hypothetical protein
MFVHRNVKCLVRKFSSQWTPFLWVRITFMSLYQSRQFMQLCMHPKIRYKFFLDSIGKKTILSVQFLMESLCV